MPRQHGHIAQQHCSLPPTPATPTPAGPLQLMASLSELLEEVQASLDLIFRWAVLRICDGNMQVRGLGSTGFVSS